MNTTNSLVSVENILKGLNVGELNAIYKQNKNIVDSVNNNGTFSKKKKKEKLDLLLSVKDKLDLNVPVKRLQKRQEKKVL
jgi:hypothetical protein